jgi:four helix bundle protein
LLNKAAKKTFEITKDFPKNEKYSLTDQIRRSSRAVNARIVESWARRLYKAAFINKLDEAMGVANETQARLDHALECEYITAKQHHELDGAWQHLGGMLHNLIKRADDFCTLVSKQ